MESISAPVGRSAAKREKEGSFKLKVIPANRPPTRYKEKFQALREKYDQVNAIRAQHHRNLDLAAQVIEKLQAENDMLLDAIYTSSPHLIHTISQRPPPLRPPAQCYESQFPSPVFPPPPSAEPTEDSRHNDGPRSSLLHSVNQTPRVASLNGRSISQRTSQSLNESKDHQQFLSEHDS